VAAEEQGEILGRIGFRQLKSGFRVPTWRARDVTREVDLIEEVARFKLPEIPFTLPRREAMFGRLTHAQRLRRQVEDVLVGAGYAEAYTPTFVAEGELRLPEPLSAEAAALRTVLYASLLEPARRNADAGEEDVALFEIARVYRDVGADLPEEHWHVAGIADGAFAEAKWAVEQIYSALGVDPAYERTTEPYLHPGRRRALRRAGSASSTRAARGTWGAFELDLDALVDAARRSSVRRGQPVSRPAAGSRIRRGRGRHGCRAAGGHPGGSRRAAARARGLRRVPQPRDDRRGEALARLPGRVRLTGGTLTDEDVAPVRASIVDALSSRFGAVLRA
jgi:phenylalanyl-tRNA synthetase beta chain